MMKKTGFIRDTVPPAESPPESPIPERDPFIPQYPPEEPIEPPDEPVQPAEEPPSFPEHQNTCFFCRIQKVEDGHKIVARFKHCYARRDDFPVSQGHTLIIPYVHTENWFTASEEVRIDLLKAVHLIKENIDEEYHPDGYNLGMNCGEAAGQTVHHLHVHLIPRYKGDMEDPRGGVRGVIPEKQKYILPL